MKPYLVDDWCWVVFLLVGGKAVIIRKVKPSLALVSLPLPLSRLWYGCDKFRFAATINGRLVYRLAVSV